MSIKCMHICVVLELIYIYICSSLAYVSLSVTIIPFSIADFINRFPSLNCIYKLNISIVSLLAFSLSCFAPIELVQAFNDFV